MIFRELQIPSPDTVRSFADIPSDTLEALRIIEPSIYGGPLKTIDRAAYLLGNLGEADSSIAAFFPELDKPKGVAVLACPSSDTLWIQNLAVSPEVRREGIGTRLLTHVEQIAKQRNFGRVGLLAIGDAIASYYEDRGYDAHRSSESSVMIELYKEI